MDQVSIAVNWRHLSTVVIAVNGTGTMMSACWWMAFHHSPVGDDDTGEILFSVISSTY